MESVGNRDGADPIAGLVHCQNRALPAMCFTGIPPQHLVDYQRPSIPYALLVRATLIFMLPSPPWVPHVLLTNKDLAL